MREVGRGGGGDALEAGAHRSRDCRVFAGPHIHEHPLDPTKKYEDNKIFQSFTVNIPV